MCYIAECFLVIPHCSRRAKGLPFASGVFLRATSARGTVDPKVAQIFAYVKCMHMFIMLLHGLNKDSKCVIPRKDLRLGGRNDVPTSLRNPHDILRQQIGLLSLNDNKFKSFITLVLSGL